MLKVWVVTFGPLGLDTGGVIGGGRGRALRRRELGPENLGRAPQGPGAPGHRPWRKGALYARIAALRFRYESQIVRAAVATSPLLLILLLMPAMAYAGGGPFGIDHELGRGDAGVFNRNAQIGLEYGSWAFVAAGALLLGNDDQLGHTFWQSADSMVLAGLSAQVLKHAFSRERPIQGDDPNAWFRGHGDQSFPSGEETLQASWVTPFILDYYHDHPWVWALELLPVYDGYARMKSQAHWQSDIIAGWLLGSGFGYWAAHRKVPLLVEILPGGVSVGFYKRF